jgi:hypothetical protein
VDRIIPIPFFNSQEPYALIIFKCYFSVMQVDAESRISLCLGLINQFKNRLSSAKMDLRETRWGGMDWIDLA